jgi:hypothetical protein
LLHLLVLGPAEGVEHSLKGFPFIDVGVSNYSPELVRLLSQQAAWEMLLLRPQLQQLLQGTGINVQAVDANKATGSSAGAQQSGDSSTNAMAPPPPVASGKKSNSAQQWSCSPASSPFLGAASILVAVALLAG